MLLFCFLQLGLHRLHPPPLSEEEPYSEDNECDDEEDADRDAGFRTGRGSAGRPRRVRGG